MDPVDSWSGTAGHVDDDEMRSNIGDNFSAMDPILFACSPS